MTAAELLALARTWKRPGTGTVRSKARYAAVDPTIRHLAEDGWCPTEIKEQLVQAKAWPATDAKALYHHICRATADLRQPT